MTTPTFPAIEPTIGARESVEYATLDAAFGDGYVQSVIDGLNARRVQWALEWRYVDAAQAHQIASFLDARAGAETFWWTPPDGAVPVSLAAIDDQTVDTGAAVSLQPTATGGTPGLLWRCRSYNHQRVDDDTSTVTARFERDHARVVAPTYEWSATGLPAWLGIDASTGLVSGTVPPAAAPAVTVTVTAIDADDLDNSASISFEVTVVAAGA